MNLKQQTLANLLSDFLESEFFHTTPEDLVRELAIKERQDRFECLINHNFTWENHRSHLLKRFAEWLEEEHNVVRSVKSLMVRLGEWKEETFALLGQWAWVFKTTMKRFFSWKDRLRSLVGRNRNHRENNYFVPHERNSSMINILKNKATESGRRPLGVGQRVNPVSTESFDDFLKGFNLG